MPFVNPKKKTLTQAFAKWSSSSSNWWKMDEQTYLKWTSMKVGPSKSTILCLGSEDQTDSSKRLLKKTQQQTTKVLGFVDLETDKNWYIVGVCVRFIKSGLVKEQTTSKEATKYPRCSSVK